MQVGPVGRRTRGTVLLVLVEQGDGSLGPRIKDQENRPPVPPYPHALL